MGGFKCSCSFQACLDGDKNPCICINFWGKFIGVRSIPWPHIIMLASTYGSGRNEKKMQQSQLKTLLSPRQHTKKDNSCTKHDPEWDTELFFLMLRYFDTDSTRQLTRFWNVSEFCVSQHGCIAHHFTQFTVQTCLHSTHRPWPAWPWRAPLPPRPTLLRGTARAKQGIVLRARLI